MNADEHRKWLVRRATTVLDIWYHAYLYCVECSTKRPKPAVSNYWKRKSLKMKTMGLIAHDKILQERT